MFGDGLWNRKLQFCGHVVGDRRDSYIGRRVYSFHIGNGGDYRNIDPRFDQIRLRISDGGSPANHYFRFGSLFTDFNPDYSDINLHANRDGHGEL